MSGSRPYLSPRPSPRAPGVAHERPLLRDSLPVISFYLAEVLMTLCDAAFVGRLGSSELAAVGLCMGAVFPLLFGGMAMVSTGSVFLSEDRARGATPGAFAAMDLGLWGCIVLTPLLVVVAFMLPAIFAASGQAAHVVVLAAQYLHVVAWFFPAALAFSVYRSCVAALGDPAILFRVCAAGVVLNLGLNYVLVIGLPGWPGLGLAGSAAATVLSNWGMTLALAAWCRGEYNYTFTPRSYKWLGGTVLRDFVRVGGPAFVAGVMESSLFGVVTILAGSFGVAALAATTIAIYLIDLFIVPALGVGDVLTNRVAAESTSQGTRAGARIALRGLLLVGALTLPWAAAFLIAPGPLVAIFLDPAAEDAAAVQRLCRPLLAVAAWALLADAAQIAISRSLKGLRDTLLPMWLAAFGYWAAGAGGGWLLAKYVGLGGLGLWYGLAGGLGLTAVALALRLAFVCKVGWACSRGPARSA